MNIFVLQTTNSMFDSNWIMNSDPELRLTPSIPYGNFSFVLLTKNLMDCSPVNLTVEQVHWVQFSPPRPGLAWPGLDRLRQAGIDHAGAGVMGSTSTKINFLLKNAVLGIF